MRLMAMRFGPCRLATCTGFPVTPFGRDDTAVALRERLKARITKTLTETFLCFTAAMQAINYTGELQRNRTAKQRIQIDIGFTDA